MRPKNLEKEQAIRTIALKIISKEGLENLSMQKLAKEARISPRTIYIKYDLYKIREQRGPSRETLHRGSPGFL